ncbi:MAG: HEAT repeat domain-containing protein, partial [Planctomycetaceae bacterium]|nr:HEAT repeat domain-containing protein [Planctomycetaceae bacterium]
TAGVSRADEPSSKGLAELIDERNSGDDKVRAAARDSLQVIGSDAAPVMAWAVEQLKRREQEPNETQGKIVEALHKLGLTAVPVMLDAVSVDYTSQRRANVATSDGYQVATRLREVVSRVLAKQPDVLPIVLAMLRDEHDALRAVAASTCAGLGDKAKPALPPLIQALHDPDGDVRLQALGAVVILSASEPSASEALCAVLRRHKDPALRQSAMSLTSTDVKSQSETVFAAVRDALNDPQIEIRVAAAELLLRTGQHRPLAEETILRECSAREFSWRQRALNVIRQQGLTDKAAALDVAMRMLNDDSFAVRLEAVEVVNALKQGADSKPRLIEMLSDDEPRVRSRVASLLWDAGDQIRAMRAWLAILQTPNSSENFELQQRLRQLTNISADVEPILIEGLAASNPQARTLVLEILARRPKPSELAVVAIQRLTRDTDQSVRSSAIRALQTIKVPIELQLKLLQESLDDANVGVRQQAIQRLGEIGKAAQPARPKLLEMLQDDKEPAPLKTSIVTSLPRMGIEPLQLLPVLAPLLKNSDQSLVTVTLQALGRMGPDAVPYVLPLADDPNSQIQFMALNTLVTLASQNNQVAPTVLPVLLKKLTEFDPQRRPSLAVQLQRLGAASFKPLAAELRHPDVTMRRLIAEALRGIGSRGAQQAE